MSNSVHVKLCQICHFWHLWQSWHTWHRTYVDDEYVNMGVKRSVRTSGSQQNTIHYIFEWIIQRNFQNTDFQIFSLYFLGNPLYNWKWLAKSEFFVLRSDFRICSCWYTFTAHIFLPELKVNFGLFRYTMAQGDGRLYLQRIVYDIVSIINIFLWIGNGWRRQHKHLG